MDDPLASSRLKLARAVEHLDSLDREVRAFAETDLDRLRTEHGADSKKPATAIWLAMEPTTLPPVVQFRQALPARFGLILGDYVGNLRAALDHAVYGLAGTQAGSHNAFPTEGDGKSFANRAKDALRGVPEPIRALIESMQPFNGHARGDRLALLARLSNIDKHRVLYPANHLVHHGVWNEPQDVPGGERWFRDEGALGDTAEVHITFIGPEHTPLVTGGAPYQLGFSDPTRQGTYIVANRVDLGVLVGEVRSIISELGGLRTAADDAAAIEMPTI